MLHCWMNALQKSIGAAIQFNKLDSVSPKDGLYGSLPGAGNFKKMYFFLFYFDRNF